MKPREVIALAPIEKTFLPDENVKKTQERPERQALRKLFKLPAPLDLAAADLRAAPGQLPIRGDARLPVRIAIMFLDEDLDARESVMVHLTTQPAGRSPDDDVLVHFVIAAAGISPSQFLIAA